MARILLTWELGSGLGHLLSLRPVGKELVRRGHEVVAALREFSNARELFEGTGIRYLAAPVILSNSPPIYNPSQGFAHILGNTGFGWDATIGASFDAWNTLFDCVRPSLVIVDHSPLALLALRGRREVRVNMGVGFSCPPDRFPLPSWVQRDPLHMPSVPVREVEMQIVARANRVLAPARRPKLERLGQLFGEVEETVLATYEELDQFGPRKDARYWGHWPFDGGAAPRWPKGEGPRIFAYLKASPSLEGLLEQLRRMGQPTIVLAGSARSMSVYERFKGPSMVIEQRALDLGMVARECDVAITNGGHGTTAALLLSGKPNLMIPLNMEQQLTAENVERAGAGILGSHRNAARCVRALKEMLANTRFREGAQRLAQRYADRIPGAQIPELVDRFETLITGGSGGLFNR